MAQSERYKKLLTRYEVLTERAEAGNSLIPDTAYADFLREQEQCSLPHMVPSPETHQGRGRGRGGVRREPRPLSPHGIRERAQHSLEESNKRLKAIEDHMWQHRQEEREVRRVEGDILKHRKTLQKQMKEYEIKIAKRQSEETQTLLSREADLVHYQQKDLHQREEATKEKTQQALAGRQKVNEHTKKFMKTENEMSWRYQGLLHSLERKRAEVEQLSQDFETRIRNKEEEQHRLKQELASLAITLNMEAQKRRQLHHDTSRMDTKTTSKEIQDSQTREDNLRSEERSKVMAGTRYENNRRGLEQSLKRKQETLQARHRQEGRHLLDVRARLQQTSESQRFASEEAEQVLLDRMGRESHNKQQLVESRRRGLVGEVQQSLRERNVREEREWERRTEAQENEARRREHQERLKQLSKMVGHHDGLEHSLFSQAKNAEAQRKKQGQVVMKMQTDLEQLKQHNAKRLKEAVVQAQQAEQELHQKIIRETAELTKAANMREESLRSLAVHRHRAKEDRRMLSEERREHQRRTRIANRTDLIAQTS